MATIFYTATSLDGFLATPDDDVSWLDGLPQPTTDTYTPFMEGVGAIAMGASSYDFLRRHMAEGNAWPYTQPAWVFTHRSYPPQEGVLFVQGDPAAFIDDMRRAAGGRDVWVVGGGDLAGQFHDAGLLDTLVITVASITLGQGKPLLPRRIDTLRLTHVQRLGAGFVELRYSVRAAGAPEKA